MEHVLIGADVPLLGLEDLDVFIHQVDVEIDSFRVADVKLCWLAIAVVIHELILRVVLEHDIHVARSVDLRDDFNTVGICLLDHPADLVLGVVAPSIEPRIAIGLHLDLQQDLVQLEVGHVREHAVDPLFCHVDFVSADGESALGIRRNVDRLSTRQCEVLTQQLRHSPRPIERAVVCCCDDLHTFG